jgi:hypothetical protein
VEREEKKLRDGVEVDLPPGGPGYDILADDVASHYLRMLMDAIFVLTLVIFLITAGYFFLRGAFLE